jgi:hypothetical protein
MNKTIVWMLALAVIFTTGMSAFAFQSANQPTLLTDRRAALATHADQTVSTSAAPIEASFLSSKSDASVRPHHDGLAQDLRAGIGLPY